MVSDLWSLVEPGGLMVIVDKGTPEGFAGIIKVREQGERYGETKAHTQTRSYTKLTKLW
jgi:ribosomal protein RSM22 (predicted rRNA methylase)